MGRECGLPLAARHKSEKHCNSMSLNQTARLDVHRIAAQPGRLF
jgi:hypothetical protein